MGDLVEPRALRELDQLAVGPEGEQVEREARERCDRRVLHARVLAPLGRDAGAKRAVDQPRRGRRGRPARANRRGARLRPAGSRPPRSADGRSRRRRNTCSSTSRHPAARPRWPPGCSSRRRPSVSASSRSAGTRPSLRHRWASGDSGTGRSPSAPCSPSLRACSRCARPDRPSGTSRSSCRPGVPPAARARDLLRPCPYGRALPALPPVPFPLLAPFPPLPLAICGAGDFASGSCVDPQPIADRPSTPPDPIAINSRCRSAWVSERNGNAIREPSVEQRTSRVNAGEHGPMATGSML